MSAVDMPNNIFTNCRAQSMQISCKILVWRCVCVCVQLFRSTIKYERARANGQAFCKQWFAIFKRLLPFDKCRCGDRRTKIKLNAKTIKSIDRSIDFDWGIICLSYIIVMAIVAWYGRWWRRCGKYFFFLDESHHKIDIVRRHQHSGHRRWRLLRWRCKRRQQRF